MPPEFEEWGQRWKDLHPTWEHRLWTDENVNVDDLQCREDYIAATVPAMKADILRYELMARKCGVYVDCDVEPLRPIDQLLAYDAFVGLEDIRGPWMGNAVLGASPSTMFFRKLLDEIPNSITMNWHKPINEQTGPVFLTRQWKQGDTAILPKIWFYPYLHDEKERRGEAFPNSYGVHHWMGSWQEA
jgi:mannosyltransferase OCH1-like enzyme